jgi:hypothetical protein
MCLALLLWGGLLAGTFLWGSALNEAGQGIKLNAPPFHGHYEWRITWRVLVPLGFGTAAALLLPSLSNLVAWRRLLVLLVAVATTWALALAFVNEWDSLTNPVTRDTEYLAAVPLVDSAGPFLRSFTSRLGDYPLHVRSHPPGFVLLLWALNELGLRGPTWVAAVEILGGSVMVAAALVALRELAGEKTARAAAPFLALAPVAVWVATTADAFFAGVSSCGVALFVTASGRSGLTSVVQGLAAGLLLGFALYLSYGMVPLIAIVLAVAIARRASRAMLASAVGVVAVAGAFYVAGFWWLDGLAATLERYRAGVASARPLGYFAVSNIAAFGAALGPAVAVALVRLRDQRVWLLAGAGLIAVVTADLSGLSKGEVERIWLPFAPWLLIAACVLPASSRSAWLALQAFVAVVIQAGIRTPW